MTGQSQPVHQEPNSGASAHRVTTMIACAGVSPLTHNATLRQLDVANENRWFDRIGFRRRYYANIAAGLLTAALLLAGIWIVTEFARLQRIAACVEAGRQNCLPLDMSRRAR